jgi:hypothetical protein
MEELVDDYGDVAKWDPEHGVWIARITRFHIQAQWASVTEWVEGRLRAAATRSTPVRVIPQGTTQLTFEIGQWGYPNPGDWFAHMSIQVWDKGDGTVRVNTACYYPLNCAVEYRALLAEIQATWDVEPDAIVEALRKKISADMERSAHRLRMQRPEAAAMLLEEQNRLLKELKELRDRQAPPGNATAQADMARQPNSWQSDLDGLGAELKRRLPALFDEENDNDEVPVEMLNPDDRMVLGRCWKAAKAASWTFPQFYAQMNIRCHVFISRNTLESYAALAGTGN